MKTIKVSEATELQLDWLVAKCESLKLHRNALLDGQIKEGWWVSGYYMDPNNWIPINLLNFSTNWAQGGPIIEQEKISACWEGTTWVATLFNKNRDATWYGHQYGPTPLIAAMRCFCANKLGETAEVPEELV